jgi:hypothetical protein
VIDEDVGAAFTRAHFRYVGRAAWPRERPARWLEDRVRDMVARVLDELACGGCGARLTEIRPAGVRCAYCGNPRPDAASLLRERVEYLADDLGVED